MVAIRIDDEVDATFSGGQWASGDPELLAALTAHQQLVDEAQSPSIPDWERYCAEAAVAFLGGEVVGEPTEPESVEGRVY